MRNRRARWLAHLGPWVAVVPAIAAVLWAVPALARVGGGEHYNSGNDSSDSGDLGILVDLIFLAIRYPAIGVPLLLLFCGYVLYRRSQSGNGSTRKAIDRMEEQHRTAVSANDVSGWVGRLKEKDPAFDLLGLFDQAKRRFLEVQAAWFRRDLAPVRRFLSDASHQRLTTQLKLLEAQGIRDAVADPQVLDLQIIGLEQSEWFDTVHIRIKASARDADVPSNATDDQALAAARRAAAEQFVEVWSFVRKPGVHTRAAAAGEDPSQGKCPNCGAPFSGGAANACEACGAIVNSGNYDWVLCEITQGMEFQRNDEGVEGLAKARQADPALNSEVLEDRASLCFWRWVEAQARAEPGVLAKVATVEFQERMRAELDGLKAQRRRKVFLQCAVGSVQTRSVQQGAGFEQAHVEIRWSARQGIGPEGERPPSLPSVPQRWVFTLTRKAGAKTVAEAGMATSRCPQCHAPLTDSASTTCDYCGAALASGERDWVLCDAVLWEAWRAHAPASRSPVGAGAQVVDRAERERLLYMMAAMAMADGVVDPKERQLLKMCSERWNIPWANVELALNAGPNLFGRLVAKQTPEAESFLRELVSLALIDGKIDRREKQLLEAAALHLGLAAQLPGLLR